MLHFNADQDSRSATYKEKLIKEDFKILSIIAEEDNCIFSITFTCVYICDSDSSQGPRYFSSKQIKIRQWSM